MDNVILFWTENTWTWNYLRNKGASYYTYIHKIFKDFAERIVKTGDKTGDMKFNSPENHIPIRQGFWYFAEKKAKFRGIFRGKFAEKSANFAGKKS